MNTLLSLAVVAFACIGAVTLVVKSIEFIVYLTSRNDKYDDRLDIVEKKLDAWIDKLDKKNTPHETV